MKTIYYSNKEVSNRVSSGSADKSGFSLVEVMIALVILMVSMMGILRVFTYAVQYNTGNNMRSQALTVLQKEAEVYRSSKFVPSFQDANMRAGVKPVKEVTALDNTVYLVATTIDDNITTSAIEDDYDASKLALTPPQYPTFKLCQGPIRSSTGVYSTGAIHCTLKEIKIVVTPKATGTNSWQNSIKESTTIQRVMGN